jgi:hypothetical protein
MYMNFDLDCNLHHVRVVRQLCGAMCGIGCGKQLVNSRTASAAEGGDSQDAMFSAALDLQSEGVEWVCTMMRSVMDAAATVHLIPVDSRTRKLSMVSWNTDGGGAGGGGAGGSTSASPTGGAGSVASAGTPKSPVSSPRSDSGGSAAAGPPLAKIDEVRWRERCQCRSLPSAFSCVALPFLPRPLDLRLKFLYPSVFLPSLFPSSSVSLSSCVTNAVAVSCWPLRAVHRGGHRRVQHQGRGQGREAPHIPRCVHQLPAGCRRIPPHVRRSTEPARGASSSCNYDDVILHPPRAILTLPTTTCHPHAFTAIIVLSLISPSL